MNMLAILCAGLISLIITLVGTRFWINFLQKKAYGQFVRDDGPTTHRVKRGTPTMGGAILILAIVAGYFGAHAIVQRPVSVSGLLLIGLIVALGIVGFIDDALKISHARSLGLGSWVKFALQGVVGITFAVLALNFPDEQGITPASSFISFARDISWLGLPMAVAVIWIALLIAGFSNGTNLTDGLDGLLTGSAAMVFVAYTIVNLWQVNQYCGGPGVSKSMCYEVRNPLDLAIIAVAITAGLFGFLWWNARPAKIFLGDTGSLALGGAVAGMAVLTRTELLVLVIGLLFVVEAFSVIAQVGYFKVSHGKCLFRMAPIHHHFEMLGWEEVTVVIRFWIIAGLSAVFGVGVFYAEWVVGQ